MQKMGGQTSTWPTIAMHDCTQSWRIFTHPLVATGKFQPGVMLQIVQSIADTTLSKQWDILNIDASYQWTTMPEGDFSFNLQHLGYFEDRVFWGQATSLLFWRRKQEYSAAFHERISSCFLIYTPSTPPWTAVGRIVLLFCRSAATWKATLTESAACGELLIQFLNITQIFVLLCFSSP